MPFNSLNYIIFLPLVFLVFYFAGDRARWFILLVASLLFYAAMKVPYLVLVLALVALLTYSFGIWLNLVNSPRNKCFLLWFGITVNLLILIIMKYLSFIAENLNIMSTLYFPNVHIQQIKPIVSLGVSFYVFQAISYLLDIYLEIDKPERHFGYFFLYLSFFPKLLQGPIERSTDLIPQLKTKYELNYDNIRFGMLLFACGLFKKIVVADRLGMFANSVYNDVHSYQGLPLLIATYFYAFQIYMDFSGYTDMALGSARLFNISLTQNFNSPYLAISVADFWRRWHITFSRWILDYIFKPLQMHCRNWKNYGTALALIITFIISGVWHGASWGFVIWGGLHGFYMACSVFYKPVQKKIFKFWGVEKTKYLKAMHIFMTFNLVCFAWIFFRANSLHDAFYIVTHIFPLNATGAGIDTLTSYIERNIFLKQSSREFCVVVIFMIIIGIISSIKYIRGYNDLLSLLVNNTLIVRWLIYYAMLFTIMIFAVYSSNTFIYYQF